MNPEIERHYGNGVDFPEMARNQVRNLVERRSRTVSYVCRA